MKAEDAENKADITHLEDLAVCVMNLVSLEEHFAFTAMKTSKPEYLEILSVVRKLRIKLMKRLITNTEGELWCISKHLLSSTMRLMEVSTKFAGKDTQAALELEKSAFDLYGLFWLLQKMAHAEVEEKPQTKKVVAKENA